MSIRTQELSKVPDIDHIPKNAHFIIETDDTLKRLESKDIITTVSKSIFGDNDKLQTVSGVIEQVELCIKNDSIHRITIPLNGWRDSSGNPVSELSTAPYTQTVNADWITPESYPELYSDMDDNISTEQFKKYVKMFSILTTGIATTDRGSISFKVFKYPISDINIILKGG
nr:MAG TPA: hypothetical protein [Caudoviricetes sp.]